VDNTLTTSPSDQTRQSGLLRRSKERPPSLLSKDDIHQKGSTLQVPDKTKLRPSFSLPPENDNNSGGTPTLDEKKNHTPKYQDALSLR